MLDSTRKIFLSIRRSHYRYLLTLQCIYRYNPWLEATKCFGCDKILPPNVHRWEMQEKATEYFSDICVHLMLFFSPFCLGNSNFFPQSTQVFLVFVSTEWSSQDDFNYFYLNDPSQFLLIVCTGFQEKWTFSSSCKSIPLLWRFMLAHSFRLLIKIIQPPIWQEVSLGSLQQRSKIINMLK